MRLTKEDLDAIRQQIDAALDARGVGKASEFAETSADSNIVFAAGGLVATEASEALLPGARFATGLAIDRFTEPADRAFIRLNCGLNADGSRNEVFGQLFAQSDSVYTDPLQNLASPQVYHVMHSVVLRDWTRDMKRPVGASVDLFPDVYACAFTSWGQLTEWCRRTREDWLKRGWVPGK